MGWLLDQERLRRSGFRIAEKTDDQRLLPDGTTHNKHAHHGDRYQLTVRDERALSFAKSREERAQQRQVKVVTVTFEGLLTITDPPALRRALIQGLGRGKAYGCGLMTLAPAPTAGK
jgi:CRISPR system Cascade subunit CasE